MEEIGFFLRLLKKYRYTITLVPIITIIITFFLVRNLPDSYVSQAQISTGIVDETQSNFLDDNGQKAVQVSQQFSNLIEIMKMKKILDQVSYRLIIHDLTTDKPFRKKSAEINELSPEQLRHTLVVFQKKYKENEGLNLWDKQESALYNILRSMKYDSESLRDDMRIFRQGDSDFINAEFTSEMPELSAYVANALAEEFISYYTYLVKSNQRNETTFLNRLVQEKKATMDGKIDSLRNYKIRNRVLNLEEQSSQLYEQILVYTDRIQQVRAGIASKAGALNEIDRKFSPSERSYLESTFSRINRNILSTKEDLQALQDAYIESGFEPQYKQSIDSLGKILSGQINRYADQYIYNPMATKQELMQQKLSLDIELDMLRYSQGSMERQLSYLNNQFDKLVPHEAEVQSMERDVDVTSKEYLDVLNKYNQSNMEFGLSVKVKLVQAAMPGLPQPSKKMLLVILSGIISFIFCVLVIFVLYFLDSTIRSPKMLANKTGSPVLGTVDYLPEALIDLKKIWTSDELTVSESNFKNQFRAVRFELDKEIKDQTLVITSINQNEGKSMVALNLAFAWNTTNKRVLIIDGNFTHPGISKTLEPTAYLEDFFNDKVDSSTFSSRTLTVMGNCGADTSLLEISGEEAIRNKLAALKNLFDLIIIETSSLTNLNQATEWFLFTENVIAVFEANKGFKEHYKQYTEYLQTLDAQFKGWIFNKMSAD